MIPIIIILVLILIIIIAIYAGVIYLSKKTKNLSRELFGTENITHAASEMKRNYASTPKSVSAMTTLLLPKITQDFPEFEFDEMKNRAENVLTSYLLAITEANASLLKEGNDELKRQLETHIETLASKDIRESFDSVHLHRTEINQYRKAAGRCIVTFQTSLECFHFIKDSSGKIIEGTKDYKYQTKFNTDLIYVQDKAKIESEYDFALGITCPNCGAPVTTLGAKYCEYCGTGITEVNYHAWTFCNVDEVTST